MSDKGTDDKVTETEPRRPRRDRGDGVRDGGAEQVPAPRRSRSTPLQSRLPASPPMRKDTGPEAPASKPCSAATG